MGPQVVARAVLHGIDAADGDSRAVGRQRHRVVFTWLPDRFRAACPVRSNQVRRPLRQPAPPTDTRACRSTTLKTGAHRRSASRRRPAAASPANCEALGIKWLRQQRPFPDEQQPAGSRRRRRHVHRRGRARRQRFSGLLIRRRIQRAQIDARVFVGRRRRRENRENAGRPAGTTARRETSRCATDRRRSPGPAAPPAVGHAHHALGRGAKDNLSSIAPRGATPRRRNSQTRLGSAAGKRHLLQAVHLCEGEKPAVG